MADDSVLDVPITLSLLYDLMFLALGVSLLNIIWHLLVGEFEEAVTWGCGARGQGIRKRLRGLLPRSLTAPRLCARRLADDACD